MTTIRFFAPGKAEPAGSKKAFVMKIKDRPGTSVKDYRAIVTDDNPEGERWKKIVALYARTVHTGKPLEGPLQLDVTFTLERPQGHFGTGKNAGNVKDSAPECPIVRPDTTKLLRCLEDGLTGILWIDDAQIVRQIITKQYGPKPGALVEVGPFIETLF